MKRRAIPFVIFIFILGASSCDENNNFVIFSVANDVQLGEQVNQEIQNDPQYDILSPSAYSEVYAYLNNMMESILSSEEISYRDEFAWQLYVIKNDEVQNAFATPGGYIYIYTGLIKYLDRADDLAGVMAHEIAHADQRHSVRNLQKIYGVNILLSVVLGNDPNTLAQIAGQLAGSLAGLSFSRGYEREADDYSVKYLADSPFACNGAASFFVKMTSEGSSQPPEFLSTHPSPDNRVEDINDKANELNCSISPSSNDGFQNMKAKLP